MTYGAYTVGGAAYAARNTETPPHHPRYTHATLAVIATQEWLDASPAERQRINADRGLRAPSKLMAARARALFDEWSGARARGLPVPLWWTGRLKEVAK